MSKWRDSIRIVRHLTAFRIWNILLLRVSFLSARIFSKPIHLGLPASMSIEPTTACNLGCPECPSGLKQFTRPIGKLDLNLHRKLLNQIEKSVFYINYYFQGEPLRLKKRHLQQSSLGLSIFDEINQQCFEAS